MLKIVATRGSEFLEDVQVQALEGLLADPQAFVWIDAWGEDNAGALELARDTFRFHPIALEDCFGAREHPKIEAFEGYLFLTTHGTSAQATAVDPQTIELDVFLGRRFLFTYHERPSRSVAGTLDIVLRNHGGPLRRGPAFLLHEILDRQVDSMEAVLDDLEERIEDVEQRVLARPENAALVSLLALKRTTLHLRRWMTKQRELVLRLARNEFEIVPLADAVLFRDTFDHLIRYTDLLDTHREMITSLQETYLSVVNLRLGEIMKFLTIFTAVLMPLTVITGIYGMNFRHMPELERWWAYPAVLAIMGVVVASVLWFFRRRGWLGQDDSPAPEPGPGPTA